MDIALGFALTLMTLSTAMSVFGVPSGSTQLAQVSGSSDGRSCAFTRDIVHRDRGDDVQCLQNYLVTLGYLDSADHSFFNLDVRVALREWQSDNEMEEVGWFGQISRRIYNKENGLPNGSIAECSFTRELVFQDSGDDVKCLQMYLWDEGYFKNEANGIYDSFTSRAIRSWQEENDLDWHGYFTEDDIARYKDLLDGSIDETASEESEDESESNNEDPTENDEDTEEDTETEEDENDEEGSDEETETPTDTSSNDRCVFNRNLVHRTRGTDVTCLQQFLIAEGYLQVGNATGFYGELTRNAVGRWQAANGMGDSNTWGPVSRIMYAEKFGTNHNVSSSCTFTRDLNQKMTGEDVRCLQTYLYLNEHYNFEATAFYGSLTRDAVRSWQLAAGVPITGNFDYASRVKFASLNGQELPPVIDNEGNIPPVVEVPEEEEPTVPPVVTVPPNVSYDVAAISNMPANSWLAYGRPWSDIDPGRAANCGVAFTKVLGAWNGGLWDGKYFWAWAGGGHADGCFNGLMRYDIEKGKPEMVVPHKPLNVPLCRVYKYDANGDPADCWNEPYVSATPWPAGVDLSKAKKLDDGPTIDQNDITKVADTFGEFLRPRSSHMYNNMIRIGNYIYLTTGQIYGSAKGDGQVWRVSATNPTESTIERVEDRFAPGNDPIGGYNVNWTHIPSRGPAFISGSEVCDTDPVNGTYDCARTNGFYISSGTTVAWDESRDGFWAADSVLGRLIFVARDGNDWKTEVSISDSRIREMGREGICLVPTENGAQPLMWGNADYLLRFDGSRLSELNVPGGPGAGASTILNKWTWNDSLEVCIGTRTTDEGMWVFKPDFASLTPGESTPTEPEEEVPLPTPTPGDQVGGEGRINLWDFPDYMKPGEYPTVGGVHIAPEPWEPAQWNESIERQPEAPDYDKLCPGRWKELHFTKDEDFEDVASRMRTLARDGYENARVYVHPLLDEDGRVVMYKSGAIKFDEIQCGEVIGVPVDGERPQVDGDIVPDGSGVGLIVRGIVFGPDTGIGWSGNRNKNTYPKFIVLHDSYMSQKGSFMGDSPKNAPQTYLEFAGNVIGNNTDWHVIYLERSIGKLIALSNVIYGSYDSGHALKNLAYESRIEGNVFSNAGVDGQSIAFFKNGQEKVGLMPLDLYACTNTVFKDNTVLFRTSGSVKTFIGYRGRRAWSNCNKGERNSDGTWDYLLPTSAAYDDPDMWEEIADATEAFDDGYESAKKESWLFTHLNEGNRYIALNAKLSGNGIPENNTSLANLRSLRPEADDSVKLPLRDEARALAKTCENASNRTTCFTSKMSDGLRYAYEHVNEGWQATIVKIGDLPSGVPIPVPDGWTERAALYVGDNEFITCNAAGTSCNRNTTRYVNAAPDSADDVQVSNPPRVYYR
jgi:peptidoglycan hydrolase-like protein with peptidoglycan-binding domain